MNKIIQAILSNDKRSRSNGGVIVLSLLIIISSCVTQVPPTQDIVESPVSTIPNVNELEKKAVKEVAIKEEVVKQEPNLIPSPPLSKDDRMNAVAEGNMAPIGIIYQKDSTELSTQSFKGQYTVIDFWATWCGPCVKEGPIFHEMGISYKDKNVQFVGVSVDRDFDRWNQFLQQRNWQGNNYWMGMAEEEAFFAFAYSEVELEPGELGIIVGLPKYVIIGPDGNILHNSSYIKPSNPKFKDLLDQHVASSSDK